jgi:hypothetical protein
MADTQIKKMPDANIAPWDDSWDNDTLQLAYEESAGIREIDINWIESIDTKVVAVFSVASAIVGLTPTLRGDAALSVERAVLLGFAGIAWLFAAFRCYFAYQPRGFTIGPNPKRKLDARWLGLTPTYYRYYALRDMAEAHEANRIEIVRKGGHLSAAIFATALEVIFLALAFLVFQ